MSNTWQPIETAPRDGTNFLGWVAAERWSSIDGGGSGRAHDESTVDFCWYVPERPDETGGYFTNAAGQIGDAQDITHWMPLPPPPGQEPAPQPVAQPLTDEQIEKLREETFSTSNPFCPCDRKTMRKAVRAAERAHGIKGA